MCGLDFIAVAMIVVLFPIKVETANVISNEVSIVSKLLLKGGFQWMSSKNEGTKIVRFQSHTIAKEYTY